MERRMALVTGASSGIGAALARAYAAHGYDLAITARRADRLEALAEEIRLRHAVEVRVIPADLAEAGAVDAILATLADHGRVVDALVNNAGFGAPGAFAAADWLDHEALLRVMVVVVGEFCRKCLPGMMERRFGRILNVASVAGLAPGAPATALYGAAKAFVVRLSQGLHLEGRDHGVHVSALCPGFTHTEFHDVSGARAALERSVPSWAWMGADEVAAAGYEATEANRPVCVPGAPYQAAAVLARLLPEEWTMALMARRMGAAFGV